MNPIFIIGTERSGTNLLRLILNAHPQIAVPHPPHIMKLFGPLEHHYGNLDHDRNFRRLISDVCRMVELHPYPWEIRLNREQVFREVLARNLLCIYFAIYDQYLAATGKGRWCCKSTFMIEQVGEILGYYPDARFILMVRDGRDVAVSAKSSIFNHYHVFYSARRWQREQRLGIDWLARLPRHQIMLLKYEELTADSPKIVSQLCDFLGEQFDSRMLAHHRTGEAKKSGSLSISWQNTAKPVLSNNTEKFRSGLTGDEVALFEAIAFREMQELGYPLTLPLERLVQTDKGVIAERPAYRLVEYTRKLKTEALHLLRDRNSAARWRKNLYLSYISTLRRFTKPDA